jgi:hypothetical protein
MQWRTLLDRKEPDRNEQHEHCDPCPQGVGSQIAPSGIGDHASRQHDKAQAGGGEGHDRANHSG